MTAPGRYRVEFAPAASPDMLDIAQFIAGQRGIGDADQFLDAILDKAQSLERFPLRGNIPKELDEAGTPEFRQVLHGPYRIIYAVFEALVVVLLIADGRRDMQALLRSRLLTGGSSA